MNKIKPVMDFLRNCCSYVGKLLAFVLIFAAGGLCYQTISSWTMITDQKLGISQISIALDDEGNLLLIDRNTKTYMLLDDTCGKKVAEMYNERELR